MSNRTRVTTARLKLFGESSTPQLTLTSRLVRTPELLLSTYAGPLIDGTLDTDSVTSAEADIRARAEELRHLAQSPVCDAGGKESHYFTPAKTTIDSAFKSVTSLACSVRYGNVTRSTVKRGRMREEIDKNDQNMRVQDNYLSDKYVMVRTIRQTPRAGGPPVSSLRPDVGDPRLSRGSGNFLEDGLTLRTSLFDLFMARDVREWVLGCGCRSRRKSASQKFAMLLGRAIQP